MNTGAHIFGYVESLGAVLSRALIPDLTWQQMEATLESISKLQLTRTEGRGSICPFVACQNYIGFDPVYDWNITMINYQGEREYGE